MSGYRSFHVGRTGAITPFDRPAARALSVNVWIIRLESCRPCWLGATLIAIAISAVVRTLRGHPAHEPLVPARRQVLERPVPGQRDGVRLREQVVAVDERDLEVREVRVQPAPVEVARLVLVHVLREGRLRELLVAALQEVGAIGVADDVHRR